MSDAASGVGAPAVQLGGIGGADFRLCAPSVTAWGARGTSGSSGESSTNHTIAIKTYLSTGIRLAFSPGVRDASKLAMGGEEFIETLPPDLSGDAADLP